MYQVEGITASIANKNLYDCTVENKKCATSLLLSKVKNASRHESAKEL